MLDPHAVKKDCLVNILQDLKDCSVVTNRIINDFNHSGETKVKDWIAAIKQLAVDIETGVVEENENETDENLGNKVPELNSFINRRHDINGRFANLMSEVQKGHLHKNKDLCHSSKISSQEIEVTEKQKVTEVNKRECPRVSKSPYNLRKSNSLGKENSIKTLCKNTETTKDNSLHKRISPLKDREVKTPRRESESISSDNEENINENLNYKTPDIRAADISSSTHSLNNVLKKKAKCKSVVFAAGKQSKRKSSELNGTETETGTKKIKVNDTKLSSTHSAGKHWEKDQENQQNNLLKTSLHQSSSFLISHNQKSSVAGLTSFLLKPPVQNPKKEVQLLKDIQKKEEKANANLKKVLTLRQMKVEENKRKREEKMEKTMQQRLKIEKEKEQRFKSHKNSVDLVAQKALSVKNSQKSNRIISVTQSQKQNSVKKMNQQKTPSKRKITQEELYKPLFHQNNNGALKENSQIMNKNVPVISNITKVNSNFGSSETPELNATYVADKAEENVKSEVKLKETKFAPDSSFVNYEISEDYVSDDDDEEEDCKKPIPSWAQRFPLKNALLTQLYHPPDLVALFGSVIDPPDLNEIFGPHKKYKKRTSSAIWHSPNRPFFP